VKGDDGIFWMSYEDFTKYFRAVNVCMVHPSGVLLMLNSRLLNAVWRNARCTTRVPFVLLAAVVVSYVVCPPGLNTTTTTTTTTTGAPLLHVCCRIHTVLPLLLQVRHQDYHPVPWVEKRSRFVYHYNSADDVPDSHRKSIYCVESTHICVNVCKVQYPLRAGVTALFDL
jgi:hypothetical protein